MSSGLARAVMASALVLCNAGCDDPSDPSPAPSPQVKTMTEGVVARVGDADVTAETVSRIAQAQGIDPGAARDLAIRDALFAAEARARRLDADPEIAFSMQGVLARRLLRTLLDEAEARGVVTDEELRETTARHWLELDRPEAFRTVHALVQTKSKQPGDRRAQELGEVIAREVSILKHAVAETPPPTVEPGRPPPEDPLATRFKELATQAFEREKAQRGLTDVELRVEPLAPVAADGRVVAPEGGQYDLAFAAAASRLGARGDASPPSASPFGVHVIMLLERTAAVRTPEAERRKLLHDEIMSARARAAHKQLLEHARRDVEVDRSADSLLALVSVER